MTRPTLTAAEIAAWNRRSTEPLAEAPEVQALIREAEARGMERADAIVEELTSDWFDPPRRYQSDRIRNFIRAEAAALRGKETT